MLLLDRKKDEAFVHQKPSSWKLSPAAKSVGLEKLSKQRALAKQFMYPEVGASINK